jgi:hypothetical protein
MQWEVLTVQLNYKPFQKSQSVQMQ